MRLRFKAPRPFYVRYALRRLLQVIVNTTAWTQEPTSSRRLGGSRVMNSSSLLTHVDATFRGALSADATGFGRRATIGAA